ncbi:MAG: lycopene cyclase domain-containing protein [Bacteroidota bacterium]
MTYLAFHAAFILPPISALIVLQRKPMGGIGAKRAWGWIALVALIAFIYTTAWDNYLVYRGVWYYGEDRVLATIGYVPIEEYMFFLLQPVLTGLWLMIVHAQISDSHAESSSSIRPLLVAFWSAVSLAGVAMLFGTRTLYMGLILAWAGPVLAGMAWLSAPVFWRHRRAWIVGIAVPTVYLWIADRFAISNGIWDISNTYSLDFDPLGLPIEEAVFFLVTNILVVQGLLMFIASQPGDLPSRFPKKLLAITDQT